MGRFDNIPVVTSTPSSGKSRFADIPVVRAVETPVEEKKPLLTRFGEAGKSIAEKPAQFLFGNVGQVAGGAIVAGIGKAKEVQAKKTGDQAMMNEAQILKKKGSEQFTPGNIAGAALEVLPTKIITKGIKLIPGIGNITSILSKSAEKSMAEALRPTKEILKRKTEKIVPRLLKEKEIIYSLKSFAEKAQSKVDEFGTEIGNIIDNIPEGTAVKTENILKSLDNFKSQFKIGDVVVEPAGAAAADILHGIVKQFGEEIPVKDVIKLRRIWDNTVAMRGGFEKAADEITMLGVQAKKEATKAIREVLAKENPILDAANKEFSFWSNVLDVSEASALRTQAQSGLLRKAAGAIPGALAGAEAGIGKAAALAFIGSKLTSLMGSPVWKSTSAVVKKQLADSFVDGNIAKFIQSVKRSGIGLNNILTQEEQERFAK